MAYEVIFAEQNLSNFCKVLNVKRDILPPRTNFSKSIPSMNGSYFTGYHYGERSITLEIGIVASDRVDYMNKVRKLADVLDVKNPSRLEISDEPTKYYYAVLDGTTDLNKLYQTSTASITFICHDPVAYAKEHKVFEMGDKNIFTIINEGTTETSPIIEVDFNSNACFFQATNPSGQTVLIGKPKDQTAPTTPATDKVVEDNCSSVTNFNALPESLLDGNRIVSGNYGVGVNGSAIICTNYGSEVENKWTGTSFKRNLGTNLEEFELTAQIMFSSEGKNYTVPPKPPNPPTPEVPAPNYGTYEVVNCGGLWVNREPNTNYPLVAIAPATKVYPTEFSGNWAKHTYTNKWGSTTGWSSKTYLKKISDSVIKMDGTKAEVVQDNTWNPNTPLSLALSNPVKLPEAPETFSTKADDFADTEVGLLEIYGFDQNGAKLFKIQFTDTNAFYEYVEPQIYIGGNLVLDDGKNCPAPRKVDVKDDSGKVTGQREVESGVFGDFNDFYGNVVVRREKNSKGQYLWSASINKIKDGKIVKSMATSNSLSNSVYPTGKLNYLGFYIGRYGKERPMDIIAVDNISIKKLNMKPDVVINGNVGIFEKGDHLHINFGSGLVSLNNKPYLTQTDIGTEFFNVPSGRSQFAVRTDDTRARVLCGIQERFL